MFCILWQDTNHITATTPIRKESVDRVRQITVIPPGRIGEFIEIQVIAVYATIFSNARNQDRDVFGAALSDTDKPGGAGADSFNRACSCAYLFDVHAGR
jgi:hypothetical protein